MFCNIDLATTVSARLSLVKFKDIEFFAQKINIPGLKSVYPKIQGPRLATAMPPQSIVYDPLIVTYFLREDMSNHKTIVNWIQESIYDSKEDVFSDGSIFTLNLQRQPIQEIKFKGLFPTSISDIEYTTTADTTVYQQATVVFDYLQYHYV